LNKKCNDLEESIDIKKTNINTKEKQIEKIKKKYKDVCHERNRLDLFLEKSEKDLKEEFNKYKEFYQLYSKKINS